MAQIKIRSDLFAAFNFSSDTKKPIGHLSALKIGGEQGKFDASLSIQNPEKPIDGQAGTEKVVGAITAIRWDGGYADPITLTCQVNAHNKTIATTLLHQGITNTSCDFSFSIYEYDHDSATPSYYKSFFCEAELNGLIEKNNGVLEMDVDSEPSEVVTSPRNYELYLSIMPKDGDTQTIKYAVAKSSVIAKGWGLKAA